LLVIALTLLAVMLPARWASATTITRGNVINQTWTPAGNPYIVQGDITIPTGAFLTIQAGTIVQFASSDGQAAGLDASRVERTVRGTLTVNGTASSPVTFQAQSGNSPEIWYGIVVDAAATSASIQHATIHHGYYGVYSKATGTVFSLQNSTLSTSSNGVYVDAGSPTLSGLTVYNTSTGVYLAGSASATLVDSVVRSNSSYGVSIYTTRAAVLHRRSGSRAARSMRTVRTASWARRRAGRRSR
jgi:nitrous oxidase accessory protein NosD